MKHTVSNASAKNKNSQDSQVLLHDLSQESQNTLKIALLSYEIFYEIGFGFALKRKSWDQFQTPARSKALDLEI